MKFIPLHMMLRLFLCVAIIGQSLLPATAALASERGFDARSYICNITTPVATNAAEAHMKALLQDIGQIPRDVPVPATDHCANCVIASLAVLPTLTVTAKSPEFFARATPYAKAQTVVTNSPCGPPLGGRAPPLSA